MPLPGSLPPQKKAAVFLRCNRWPFGGGGRFIAAAAHVLGPGSGARRGLNENSPQNEFTAKFT